ncbi:MAG: GGDEF domain-containing protein [Patescibacteria group bacterium]
MTEELKKLKKEIRDRDVRIRVLENAVTKDPLTGLLNRRGFMELAEKLAVDIRWILNKENTKREHYFIDSLTVLFFDIDNFKKINDTFGHEIGDKILKFVSGIIRDKIRNADFVARFGGEEMVAALVGAGERDSIQKAEEIRKAIKSRVVIPKDKNWKVTVSVGVASFNGKESITDLVKRADQAMYHAKKSGKDQVMASSKMR